MRRQYQRLALSDDARRLAIIWTRRTGKPVVVYSDVQNEKTAAFAALTCPCGKSTVAIPVSALGRDVWLIQFHAEDGTFSLSPSLIHSGTCECHYFWKHGTALEC